MYEQGFYDHYLHRYGLSPECICLWRIRLPKMNTNLFQLLLLYSFSLAWVLMCIRRYPFPLKALLQLLHLKCFSPVCSQCQWQHRYVFPQCTSLSVSKVNISVKKTYHNSNTYAASLLCIFSNSIYYKTAVQHKILVPLDAWKSFAQCTSLSVF